MKKTMLRKIILLITIIIGVATAVAASSHLPPGLIQGIEANRQLSEDFVTKVTIGIAFLAGTLTILSPCILPLIPAFFAITFREKKQITKMTTTFFIGFALVFLTLGIVAATVGSASIILLQDNLFLFTAIGATLLIIFGIMTFFGKGFSGLVLEKRWKNDTAGIFLYGAIFALGWSVCVGPILGGILMMASVLHNYVTALYLMLAYAIGMFVPIFALSFAYDRWNLAAHPILKGKAFTIHLGKHTQELHSTNIISGILLMGTGIFLLIFQNTGVVNTWDVLRTKARFYTLQDALLGNASMLKIIGLILLTIIVITIIMHAWKQR